MLLLRILSTITKSERGTSSVEYGLILAFIVLIVLIAIQATATQTVQLWTDVAAKSAAAQAQN
ncbi:MULTISPECIES: Flp family type IVb pilin [unclassified Novosphingobium]|uniref:Flp family type IVb pilin n=1 Tax=unclassified Novosphingobium TaxID=2644732 RepID=UPI00135673C7|nr:MULTISPECIES: Flp family type IVb pilin [unclassified Novosphingobium]